MDIKKGSNTCNSDYSIVISLKTMKILKRNYSINRIIKKGLVFEYNNAFTRDISKNINNGLRLYNSNDNVNIDLSIEQKEIYKNVLKEKLGLKITNLESDDLPDSCFIEDTMIIHSDRVCITTPGALSRTLETDRVRNVIKEFNYFKINDMINDPSATLDGGDVLFTGKEFFIGVNNNRTNMNGLKTLSNTFPGFNFTPIDLGPYKSTVLHLKSVVTGLGENKLIVGGRIGKEIGKIIESLSNYEILHVSDIAAANVLYLNDTVIVRSSKEFPNSISKIRDRVGKGSIIEINMSELSKLDGALSCCSVLFNR